MINQYCNRALRAKSWLGQPFDSCHCALRSVRLLDENRTDEMGILLLLNLISERNITFVNYK